MKIWLSGSDDINPVYGENCEVDEETEIYNTKAYYGVDDVEEGGSTMISDNNLEYE